MTVGPQVPLKQVVSLESEESSPELSQEDLLKQWNKFKAVYGWDPKHKNSALATSPQGWARS